MHCVDLMQSVASWVLGFAWFENELGLGIQQGSCHNKFSSVSHALWPHPVAF